MGYRFQNQRKTKFLVISFKKRTTIRFNNSRYKKEKFCEVILISLISFKVLTKTFETHNKIFLLRIPLCFLEIMTEVFCKKNKIIEE